MRQNAILGRSIGIHTALRPALAGLFTSVGIIQNGAQISSVQAVDVEEVTNHDQAFSLTVLGRVVPQGPGGGGPAEIWR